MPKKLYILYFLAVISFTYSCKYTKHVPQDKSILWNNEITLDGNRNAPTAAYNILKQRPVPHYSFLAPNLAIYNWGNGSDSSFFSKVGDAPVIFDPAKAQTGAIQLQNYYFNKGYFKATSRYELESAKNRRWVYVDYFIERGDQYFIRNYEVEIPNSKLIGLYNRFYTDQIVQEKQAYDAALLNKERDRLTSIFKDNGFYKFSRNYITFEADTFAVGDSVNIKMIIASPQITVGDSLVEGEHEQYRIANVYVRPDYSFLKMDEAEDTASFRKYLFVYDSLEYKPRYFTDAIHFNKGDLYTSDKVKKTYSHLNSYNTFKLTEINFKEIGRDSLGPLLNAIINISPFPQRTFITETEATSTSGNYGISLSFGWLERNVFGAGEQLDFKFNSGIEFQSGLSDQGTSQTYELGGEIGLKFPRFLLPFNTVDLLSKRMRPTSRISIFGSRVLRNEFDRETFGGRLTYNWNENSRKSYQVDLLDISFSRLFDLNDDFLATLNEIQSIAFEPALIMASRATYTYNQQNKTDKKNHNFLKLTGESAGFLLSRLESGLSFGTETTSGINQIGDVPYYQYIKLEADYRYYWNFSPKSSWVNRVYAGTIRPYGNSIQTFADGSQARQAPFAKYLFIGGSNDLRAWPAYRLGAGTGLNTNYDSETNNDSNFALGTIKILFNSEYRFPMFSLFKGAFFVDAGNIWLNGGLEDEETDFIWEDIINQLAIGAGFGIRMDFDFFVVRLDMAAKVRDPGRISIGDPWVIDNRPFSNLTYNIALGYPF